MFWSRMFKRWRKAWTARRSPKACRRPPARPWLEPLEDRFCPDSTTWKAMAAGAWDNRDNWTDGVPDATKDAIFNATANTNVNSETVDAVAKTISIDGYTANIKLQSLTLGSATASGTSTIKSGTITITYGAAFGLDLFGTLDFSGGTISTGTPPRPLIPPDFKVESGATANISGTANFAGSFDLFNDGSVTVSTSNNIVLGSGARVENYGTLIVQTDITFVGSVFQGRGEFDNIGGTFQKTAGTGTTTVQLPFTNTGTFEVRTGTVSLTDPGDQKQTSGTTTIYAGARLAVVTTYVVSGGTIEGNGAGTSTLTGNLTLSGGNFYVGTDGTIGTFFVTNIYTQSGGTLHIDVDGAAQSQVSDLLQVGSQAKLGGTLEVNTLTTYPDSPFNILTYTSVLNDFAAFTWNPFTYNRTVGTSAYSLLIQG